MYTNPTKEGSQTDFQALRGLYNVQSCNSY